MIVVHIEIWPKGNKAAVRKLATIVIENIGGTVDIANYVWRISGEDIDPRLPWKVGRVSNFSRKLGVMRLLVEVLKPLT